MNFITQISVPVNVLINIVYSFSFYRLIEYAINFLRLTGSLMLNIYNIERSISHSYCFKHYILYILHILFTVIRFYFTIENTEITCTPIQK